MGEPVPPLPGVVEKHFNAFVFSPFIINFGKTIQKLI
jgi:hypothetical protein